jgi:hydrogenase maturation factor
MGITVVGGHMEVTPKLNRPIIVGSLIGEVEKHKLVLSSGAEPGDKLILTKGIFIEGTSIIGREKENDLIEKGFNSNFIEKCKNYLYDPGISVFKEALLANDHFKIKAMHDATEGGVAMAIAEVAIASNTGVIIEKSNIDILQEPLELSKQYNINPMGTISSGSLLIVVDSKDSTPLVELLIRNKIKARIIGEFNKKENAYYIRDKDGIPIQLKYSETDEITKIF